MKMRWFSEHSVCYWAQYFWQFRVPRAISFNAEQSENARKIGIFLESIEWFLIIGTYTRGRWYWRTLRQSRFLYIKDEKSWKTLYIGPCSWNDCGAMSGSLRWQSLLVGTSHFKMLICDILYMFLSKRDLINGICWKALQYHIMATSDNFSM